MANVLQASRGQAGSESTDVADNLVLKHRRDGPHSDPRHQTLRSSSDSRFVQTGSERQKSYQDRLRTAKQKQKQKRRPLLFLAAAYYCESHNNRPKTAETSAIRVS